MNLFLLVSVFAVSFPLASGRRRSGHVRDEMLGSNRPSKTSAQEAKSLLLSSTCDDCKSVVKTIDDYAKNPVYVEVAKEGLKAFCQEVFTDQDLQACLQLAERLPSVISQLKPLLDNPDKLCAMVFLCGHKQNKAAGVLFMAFKRQMIKVPLSDAENNAVCDGCVLGVEELKTLWEDKQVEQSVEDGLKSICSAAAQYQDTCKALVDQYWPTLVQAIEDELKDPKGVCSQIGLCATRIVEVDGHGLFNSRPSHLRIHRLRSSAFIQLFKRLARTQTANGDRATCTICTLAFDSVQRAILNGGAVDDAVKTIERELDHIIPSKYRAPVENFLSTYLKPMIDLILRQMNAKEACEALNACDEYSNGLSSSEINQWKDGVEEGVVCDACKVFVEGLNEELSQPDVQKSLTQQILQICNFIPGAYSDECDELVKENLPTIFADFIQQLVPNTLCPKLGLCPAKRLLGSMDEEEDPTF